MKIIKKVAFVFLLTGIFAAEDGEKNALTGAIHALVRSKHPEWEFQNPSQGEGGDFHRFRYFRWNIGKARGADCEIDLRILKSIDEADSFLHSTQGLGMMPVSANKSLPIGDEAFLFQADPVAGLPEPGCTIMFRRSNVFIHLSAYKRAVGEGFAKEIDAILLKEKGIGKTSN